MKKKNVLLSRIMIVVSIILIICGLAGVIPTVRQKSSLKPTEIGFKQVIEVTAGTAYPTGTKTTFDISETGNYRFYLSWLPEGVDKDDVLKVKPSDLGCITAVMIFDSDGNLKDGFTAGAILCDTLLYLEKGRYTAEYRYLTNVEDFKNLAETYLYGKKTVEKEAEKSAEFYKELDKNGVHTMNYEIRFSMVPSSADLASESTVWLALIIGVSLCLVVLINRTGNGMKATDPAYDERQELERGRGFKYAFYSIVIGQFLAKILNAFELLPDQVNEQSFVMVLFLGIAVYADYCIWHEAYLGLRNKFAVTTAFLGVLAFLNILTIILYMKSGISATLQFPGYNVCCLLLILSAFVTMFVKSRINAKEAEDEES